MAEIDRLRAENRRLQERYRALRNRRVVRYGLALAEVLGRVGRWRRRTGTPTATTSVAQPPRPAPAIRSEHPPPLELLDNAPPVSVVIPVFQAPDALRRCLRSVIAHTSTARRIVVIDDGSTDGDVIDILSDLPESIDVLRNEVNRGFVATANRGFAETTGDVILLNADTEVGPRWVERLRLAAYAAPSIGSVTPFSDNSGAFSAPVAGRSNPLPAGMIAATAARLVARHSDRLRPEAPTGNGFCMYIKRQALEDVGPFDVEAYPRGYGEENDWSMRAGAVGWRHVVDDASYVLHQRSASFGPEREALAEAGRRRLDLDHPAYEQAVRAFLQSRPMAEARRRIGESLDGSNRAARPRVLYLLHAGGGGTPATSRDLVAAIGDRYEGLIARSDGRELTVTDAEGNVIRAVGLTSPIRLEDARNDEYRRAVAELLIELDVDLLHIRHLMHHGLGGPDVARSLGVPVVLSIHDFYLVCPTAHLIDDRGSYCGGRCTPGQGVCPSMEWVARGPHLKHEFVHVWATRTARMMEDVDVLVAANPATRDLFQAMFPHPVRAPWRVIEHGRDLPRTGLEWSDHVGPIRLLVAGAIGAAKGARFVQELRAADGENRIELHLLGDLWPDKTGLIDHGPYEREGFADRVAAIAPDALLMPAVWPETYSHIVTEAWSVGLPVIATDLGAPAERIRRTGAGWLIDPTDPVLAVRQILEGFEDGRFHSALARVGDACWPSTAEMADGYADLYDEVIDARLTVRGGGGRRT